LTPSDDFYYNSFMTEQNWGIIGHQKIIRFLNRSIEADRLAQTYLFYGPRSLGKATVAERFAEVLLKSRQAKLTDLYKVELLEGKKNIAIEQIREWRQKLRLKSFDEAGYKVGLIDDAERLNLESANALLKAIEEPTPKTVIILVTADWDRILPTIISRSQLLRFSPASQSELLEGLKVKDYPQAQIDKVSQLASGLPGKAINFLNNPELFTSFKKLHQAVLKTFSSNLAERFLLVEKLLAAGEDFNQKVAIALDFIKHFQFVFRDLLLRSQNLTFWLRHQDLISRDYSLSELIAIGTKLRDAERQLIGNIQPRLVLENLLINL